MGLEKEELKKKVMQLIQLVDERALGRKLITAETGVIHRGWLRWKRRRPPRADPRARLPIRPGHGFRRRSALLARI